MDATRVTSIPEEAQLASDKPPIPDPLEQKAVAQFKVQLEEREKRDGVVFLSATGLVVVNGQVRKVWAGCPRRNPARDTRRQANLMAPIFGWRLNSRGKLSGRQWKILRRTARRHRRQEEAGKQIDVLSIPINSLASV